MLAKPLVHRSVRLLSSTGNAQRPTSGVLPLAALVAVPCLLLPSCTDKLPDKADRKVIPATQEHAGRVPVAGKKILLVHSYHPEGLEDAVALAQD